MSADHFIVPQIPRPRVTAVRLGAGNAENQRLKDVDQGKFAKLAGESRYDLAALGDRIEAIITSVEPATQNGYSIGGIQEDEKLFVTCDGLQATPGVGAIAVKDYVLVGTVVPLGTNQPGYPRVVKATDQAAAAAGPFVWRVVSIPGAGAVGTRAVIARVS